MILSHDEDVLAELCRGFTAEQRSDVIRLADMIIRNIDTE